MRRYVLVLGLLIAGSASAQAATLNHHDTHHDTSHHVFVDPKVAPSFDAVPGWAEAPRPSIRYDVPRSNDRWDPWGLWGAYYGPPGVL